MGAFQGLGEQHRTKTQCSQGAVVVTGEAHGKHRTRDTSVLLDRMSTGEGGPSRSKNTEEKDQSLRGKKGGGHRGLTNGEGGRENPPLSLNDQILMCV